MIQKIEILNKIAYIYNNIHLIDGYYEDDNHKLYFRNEMPHYKRYILIDRIKGTTGLSINYYGKGSSLLSNKSSLRLFGKCNGENNKPLIMFPVSLLTNLDANQDYMQIKLSNDSEDIKDIENIYEMDYLDSFIEYIDHLKHETYFNGFKSSF